MWRHGVFRSGYYHAEPEQWSEYTYSILAQALEYEDCCWALRAVARQYRYSPVEVDAQTGFYLELELKGLSRLGGGLETILQNSIFGYQPIRY